MRPTQMHRGELEVRPDVEGGWFVGVVGNDFVARTVLRIGGPAVQSLNPNDVERGNVDLSKFLHSEEETPHAYTALPGVQLSLKNPFDDDARPIMERSKVTELHPPSVSTRA